MNSSRSYFVCLDESGETWHRVPGYDDAYEVSDRGRVKSHKRRQSHLLNACITGGYLVVELRSAGKRCCKSIHRLVAEAFLGPKPGRLYVTRHLDGNPFNNLLTNLAWGTHTDNFDDARRHGAYERGGIKRKATLLKNAAIRAKQKAK